MNGKQTVLMAVVGMALFATVITMSSPPPALALSHWNLDEDTSPNTGLDSSGTTDDTEEVEEEAAGDEDRNTATITQSNDNSEVEEDSSQVVYEEFQGCLSSISGEPTELEVQDCLESSYGGMDSSEDMGSTEDGGEHVSANDLEEDEEDEDMEQDENSEE
jgi:hypothetical protein